jgi:hypothetical protein
MSYCNLYATLSLNHGHTKKNLGEWLSVISDLVSVPIKGVIFEIMPQTIKCEELNEYRISIRLSKYPFISWMSLSVGIRL